MRPPPGAKMGVGMETANSMFYSAGGREATRRGRSRAQGQSGASAPARGEDDDVCTDNMRDTTGGVRPTGRKYECDMQRLARLVAVLITLTRG